jgi:pyruvate dehydrogenase kinase 2/3/4
LCVWRRNFSFSTAPQGMGELAGFGHGLPLSRRYARYWGGDMEVFNMENLGLDVYVRLGVPDNAAKYKAPEWKKRDSNAGNTSNDPQLRR